MIDTAKQLPKPTPNTSTTTLIVNAMIPVLHEEMEADKG